jgi:hypothetical protein
MILTAVFLLFQEGQTVSLEQLRSKKPEVREEAGRRLRALGREAIPLLEKALLDSDQEVALRSKDILRQVYGDLAQKDLTRFGGVIDKAKTLRIEFNGEMALESQGFKKTFSGCWLFGTGNKASGSLRTSDGKKGWQSPAVFWSDGARTAIDGCDAPGRPEAAEFRGDVLSGLVNFGAVYSSILLLRRQPEVPAKIGLGLNATRRSAFGLNEDGKVEWKQVFYRQVVDKGDFPPMEARVWFKAGQDVPFKRTITLLDTLERPCIVFSEDYSVFKVDEEIPEWRFSSEKDAGTK